MLARPASIQFGAKSGQVGIIIGRQMRHGRAMKSLAARPYEDPGFFDHSVEDELVSELIRPHFSGSGERLLIFAFDRQHRLVGFQESSDTQLHRAILSPLMVRRTLALPDAYHLMLAHNHPSGDASPSRRDLDLTRKLASVCALAGLTIIDHIILTDAGHFSFRAAGLV